jgi:hypothetical protein
MSSGKDKPKVSRPSLPTLRIDDRYILIRWHRNETRGVVEVMKNGVSDYQRERRLIEIRKASAESKGWRTVHIDKTHQPPLQEGLAAVIIRVYGGCQVN